MDDGNRPDFDPPGAASSPAESPPTPAEPDPAPAAPARPTTDAPAPRRRTPLILGLVGLLVVLVAIGGVLWWTLGRSSGAGEGRVPVPDIDTAPEITWTFQLPENAADLQWAPVADDQALVFSSAIDPADPSPVFLIDVTDGSTNWELDLTEAAGEMAAEWVVGQDLPGTDFVSINLYTGDGQSPSTFLLVNRATGELHSSRELGIGEGILTAESGNIYRANWLESTISRVDDLANLDDILWTSDIPTFEGGDFNIGIEERNGWAMYGRVSGMGGVAGYDWPLYFAAADVEDGTTPAWMPADAEASSFALFDDVVVQMIQRETTRAVGLDPDGSELWHLDNFTGVVMPLGEMMFVIDHREDHTAITRYDPKKGTPMWDTPSRLPVGSALVMVDDKVVALSTAEPPQAVTINPADGQLGHTLTFPQTYHHQYFVGTDRLYVATRSDPGTDLTLIAQPVDQPGSLWTTTFPPVYEAAQVGRHLVLIDMEQRTMAGIGTP